MCMRCEGYSLEEIDRANDLIIRIHGFLIQQVLDEDGPGWTYTVGLRETHDHAELICVDVEPDAQTKVIRTLADEVARSGRIDERLLEALDVELLEVDDVHLRDGLVAVWERRSGRPASRGDVLQILPGPSWFCNRHVGLVRRLDDPTATRVPHLNRAQRRAAAKRRRR